MQVHIEELNEQSQRLKNIRREFDRDLENSSVDSSGIRIKLDKIKDIQLDLYEVLILIQSNHETELKTTKQKLKENNSEIVEAINESIVKIKHALITLEHIKDMENHPTPEEKLPLIVRIFQSLDIKKLMLLLTMMLMTFLILLSAYHYFPEASKWAIDTIKPVMQERN